MLTNSAKRERLIRKIDALQAQLSLNDIQQLIFQVVSSGKNVFITGSAGCGKSYLSETIKKSIPNLVVLGPTGMSALNVGGQTIHSFFSFHTGYIDPIDFIKKIKKEKLQLLKKVKYILIDEISMVRADVFDNIDVVLRKLNKSKKPFGGCQIILVGDFCQLEPIVKTYEERKALQERYGKNVYAFNADAWLTGKFVCLSLISSERTSDSYYIKSLRNIRMGHEIERSLNTINQITNKNPPPPGTLRLCTTNAQVNKYNGDGLDSVAGFTRVYTAVVKGNINPKDCIAEKELELKVGSRVMAIANKTGSYVNGDLGEVIELGQNYVRVRLDRGGDVKVTEHVWKQLKYTVGKSEETDEEVVKPKEDGSLKQIPLKLAYAITIHKSQGQTLDKAILDLTQGTFGCGQAYVGLSRMTKADGLYLAAPLDETLVLYNEEAVNFSKQIGYEMLEMIPILKEKYNLDSIREKLAKDIRDAEEELSNIAIEHPKERKALGINFIKEAVRRTEIGLQVGLIKYTQMLKANNIIPEVSFKNGNITNMTFIHDDITYKWKEVVSDETFVEYLERNEVDTEDYPEDFINKVNSFSNAIKQEEEDKKQRRESLLKKFLGGGL